MQYGKLLMSDRGNPKAQYSSAVGESAKTEKAINHVEIAATTNRTGVLKHFMCYVILAYYTKLSRKSSCAFFVVCSATFSNDTPFSSAIFSAIYRTYIGSL